MSLLKISQLGKVFESSGSSLEVLKDISLSLDSGDLIGISGISGSGKSTLLHILGGLDVPTTGKVFFEGRDLYSLPDTDLANIRNRSIGFVFQFFHLLPGYTALENVMLPGMIAGMKEKEAKLRALELLEDMSLKARMDHYPSALSGGEKQRVAIARSLFMRPKLLLADEPTGNLDEDTGTKVWEELLKIRKKQTITMIVVSHNKELLKDTRCYHLHSGCLS